MTDFSRLSGYIIDFFPEPKYSPTDIRDWASENVPVWDKMSRRDQKEVIEDWKNSMAQPIETEARGWAGLLIRRIRNFLGRLF